MELEFEPHPDPDPREVREIDERLYAFNAEATGYRDGRGLGFVARDASGGIVAALTGYTWGRSCWVAQVWVDAPLRRRGAGRRLLALAEAEARARGCRHVLLTTHSFQAPDFYRKLGFEEIGRIDDHPEGHADLIFRKRLGAVR